MSIDQNLIATLKAKYPGTDLYLVEVKTEDMAPNAPPIEIVYRRPTEAEFAAYMAKRTADASTIIVASRELASAVVLVPEVKDFSALMDRFGGICIAIANRAKGHHLEFEVSVAKKL